MGKRCLGCMEHYDEGYEVCPHCGYVEGTGVEEAIHLNPGTFLANRYIVGKVLGYGGFGVTYIGWDGKLEQKVAIKEYLPSEFSTRMPGATTVTVFNGDKEQQYADGLSKFVDEAKRLSKFQNEPGIVKVFDAFEENGTAYIVMELLEGETLTERLKREGTIPEDESVAMLLPLMQSLQAVHGEGILHRDIAPDNIFLTTSGDVKLIDFGASRYATTSHSRSLTVIVKPGYSPEEQYRSRGDQGPHTDTYALGATLYKMITGKTPPDAMERRAKVESTNRDPLERPKKHCKSISDVSEVAIMNALNVQVEDRTPDIPTFIEELTADTPAPRRGSALKRIDLYTWPLWLKVLMGAVGAGILTLVVLLLTGVISFQSLFSNASIVPEGHVEVPAVEEMDKDEAVKLIQEAGLVASAEGNVESEYQPAGVIVLQSPNGGTYIEEGATVSLTVSSGTGVKAPKDGVATVPYVIWDTKEDALAKLQQAGLGEPSIIEAYSTSVAAGRVMAQSEEYGTQLPEGYKITITISLGAGDSQQPESGNSGGRRTEKPKTRVVSDWVPESQVPSGATIIASYYTYTYTEYNTSSNSSSNSPMEGWNEYSTQQTGWTNWGNWVECGKSEAYNSDTREYKTEQKPTYGTRTVYYYYHYCNGIHYYGNYDYGDGWWNGVNYGKCSKHTRTVTGSPLPQTGNCPYGNQAPFYGDGVACVDGCVKWFPNGSSTEQYQTGTTTKYYYRTRSPIYTHYYSRTSQQQSNDYPSGSNISNIQHWVQYEQWV